jgi:hypothetical protein
MHAFGTKDLVGLVGISRSRIRALIRAGHVRPGRGRRGELRFSFQDLIILRTAKALAAADIPVRRINQSLRQLQASLPPEVPLSGLSITSVGDRIAVREGVQQREIDSGQYVLALNVVKEGGKLKIIDRSARAPTKPAPAIARHDDGDALFTVTRAATMRRCCSTWACCSKTWSVAPTRSPRTEKPSISTRPWPMHTSIWPGCTSASTTAGRRCVTSWPTGD